MLLRFLLASFSIFSSAIHATRHFHFRRSTLLFFPVFLMPISSNFSWILYNFQRFWFNTQVMMQSFRKIWNKPRPDDWMPLARFYYADSALNDIGESRSRSDELWNFFLIRHLAFIFLHSFFSFYVRKHWERSKIFKKMTINPSDKRWEKEATIRLKTGAWTLISERSPISGVLLWRRRTQNKRPQAQELQLAAGLWAAKRTMTRLGANPQCLFLLETRSGNQRSVYRDVKNR